MTSSSRQYQWFDHFIIKIQSGLQSLQTTLSSDLPRENPSQDIPEAELSIKEKKLAANLMRINHAGEVCAQALYLGQSFCARDPKISDKLQEAAKEEIDHLKWCEERLNELNSHTSYLNPFWFMGSLTLGTFAGICGDKWSLGFLAETENQVFNHLSSHLEKLPPNDLKSRIILSKMRQEESEHAQSAVNLGAATLPFPIKMTMRFASKIMTTLTFYV